jgi:hypothetical protein
MNKDNPPLCIAAGKLKGRRKVHIEVSEDGTTKVFDQNWLQNQFYSAHEDCFNEIQLKRFSENRFTAHELELATIHIYTCGDCQKALVDAAVILAPRFLAYQNLFSVLQGGEPGTKDGGTIFVESVS